MIHRGIEDLLRPCVWRIDRNARKLLVPFLDCLVAHSVEIPMRQLRLHVRQGIRAAHRGDRNLHQCLLCLALEGNHTLHSLAGQLIVARCLVIIEHGQRLNRLVALQHEEHLVRGAPTV